MLNKTTSKTRIKVKRMIEKDLKYNFCLYFLMGKQIANFWRNIDVNRT